MDLLATVRKEGSRGGRGDFKWSDVQSSSHRENYLGHSLMAPVGRWQKGRDLNWYSKAGGDENAADREARERKEEIKRVKEAEQDAMARALGLPVPDRSNPNLEALGSKRDEEPSFAGASNGDSTGNTRGLGFKSGARWSEPQSRVRGEIIEGSSENHDKELQYALREYRRRHTGDREHRHRRRSRSRSRSPSPDLDRRRHGRTSNDEHRYRRRHRRTSRSRERPRARRSRSRSRERQRRDADRNRARSRSPYRRNDSPPPRRMRRQDD